MAMTPDEREAWIDGLIQMAVWARSHPDAQLPNHAYLSASPYSDPNYAALPEPQVWDYDTNQYVDVPDADARRAARAEAARVWFGRMANTIGSFTRDKGYESLLLKKKFGPHTIVYSCPQEATCERVQTGTRIERRAKTPPPESIEYEEVEVPVYEYTCPDVPTIRSFAATSTSVEENPL